MTDLLGGQTVRPTSLDDLANYISGTGTRNRKRQLPFSSIDDASLRLKTGGVVSAYVGTQWDGTTGVSVVNGPKPPRPAQAQVTTTPGGITVRWDGTFDPAAVVSADGVSTPVIAPGDFKGVEIQVSESSFTGTFADVRGPLLTSARGGDVFIPWPDPDTRVYVRLVVRATTGKASDPGPVAEGITGATAGTVEADTVPPAKVTGLQLATYTALDATGVEQGYIVATWTEAAQNADQSMLVDLSHYQVQWRWAGRGGDQWQETTSTEPGVQLPATTGLVYQVRVRAVDRAGNAGAWSDTYQVTVAVDTTPPQPPEAPTVTNYMGQLRIRWSGYMQDLGDPPADFNYVEVHVGTTADFSPVQGTKVSQLVAAGEAYAVAPYGQTRYVRLYAYDRAGNRSQSSVVVAGSTSKVVGDDILAGAVGSAQLANLAVKSANIDLLAVNTSHIAELNVGRLTGGILQAGVVLGTGRIGTAEFGARTELNGQGFQKFRADGSKAISLTDTESLLTGTFMTAESGRRITIGAGNTTGVIDFWSPDRGHGFIRGYTERSGVESLQLSIDAPRGTNFLWNSININSIGITSYQAIRHIMTFTTEWAAEFLPSQSVYDPINPANHGGQRRLSILQDGTRFRDSADRLTADFLLGIHRFYPGGEANGSIQFIDNGGTSNHSARLRFVQMNGVNLGMVVKTVSGSLEVRNFDDNAFSPIRASVFEVNSDQRSKTGVKNTTLNGMAMVKAMRIRDYKIKRPWGDEAEVEVDQVGLVAQEARDAGIPIVTGEGSGGALGIDLYQYVSVLAKAVQELAVEVESLERPGRAPA